MKWSMALVMLLTFSVCSCSGEKGSTQAVIRGLVVDTNGYGIRAVEILVNDVVSAKTDYRGYFQVNDAPTGTVVVKTQNFWYSTAVARIQVDEQAGANLTLTCLPMMYGNLQDAENGGVVTGYDGFSLTLPANSLFTAGNTPVSGQVNVHWVVLNRPADMGAAPGGMLVELDGGEIDSLESFGMVDVKFSQNDEALVFQGTAELKIPLASSSTFGDGETVGLYSFDESLGLWKPEGTGTVDATGAIPVFVAQASHFSWWNCDEPLEDKNCIQGVMKKEDGSPGAGLSVNMQGEDYLGNGSTTTALDGSFCIDVKRGSLNTITVWGGDGNGFYSYVQTGIQVADQPADCSLGGCTDIGEHVLSTVEYTCVSMTVSGFPQWYWPECPQGCLSGEVVDENGVTIAWVNGTTQTPGSDPATFCFTIPKAAKFRIQQDLCSAGGQTEFDLQNLDASCDEDNCQDLGSFNFCHP
jgi:hypothetical protein